MRFLKIKGIDHNDIVEHFSKLKPGDKLELRDRYFKGSSYGFIADLTFVGISRVENLILVTTESEFDPSKNPDEITTYIDGYQFSVTSIKTPFIFETIQENKTNIDSMSTSIGISPLYDRVLVKPDEQQEQTQSGIIIPVESRKKSNIGTVVAAGEGTPAHPMFLKPGDRILYQRYAGLDVEWDGQNYAIILTHEVIAKIDPDFKSDLTYKDQLD